jgi:hypothetical protein
LAVLFGAVLAAHIAVIAGVLLTGGFVVALGPLTVGVRSVWRLVQQAALCFAALVLTSPRVRAMPRDLARSPLAFFTLALIAAWWFSLGPTPMSLGVRVAGAESYRYLYAFVPGIDGLRVPARLAMIVALCLAITAAYGLLYLERAYRTGGIVLGALGFAFLVEAAGVPVPLNQTFKYANLQLLSARVYPPSQAPAVYKSLTTLPDEAVIVEFPFGVVGYEVRYMFYSTLHWKRMLNGYSGGFPPSYTRNQAALSRVIERPEAAWAALSASGATHAIVHEKTYPRRRRRTVSRWLRHHGAREIARFGTDHVFVLPAAGMAPSGH